MKKYEDCVEFYWMFLNTSNGIPANNVTGTIKLPGNVSDIDNLRVWAHGSLNGEIERTNTNTASFSIKGLSANTMLETRVAVLDTKMFSDIHETIPLKKFNSIVEEETKWANEANELRNRMRAILIAIITANLIVIAFFLPKLLKYYSDYKKIKEETKSKIPNYEYFRDIPREKDATPAEAAYLYYMNQKKSFTVNYNKSNVLSATITYLYLKGFINIIINEVNKELKSDEKKVYELLKTISNNSNSVTIKEIEKYAKKHYSNFLSAVDSFESIAKSSHKSIGNIEYSNEDLIKKYKSNKRKYIFGILALCFTSLFFYTFPIILIWILCVYMLNKCISSFSPLSEKGLEEMAEWKGLGKYLKDYSLIKDREVFEVTLWEKFLVFATAFGIADTVLKQMKIAYPEITDTYLSTNPQYHAIYMMSNTNYSFCNAINNAYKAGVSARNIATAATSSSSSGGGYGGGFSSGGGGGGGRRQYGWKITILF